MGGRCFIDVLVSYVSEVNVNFIRRSKMDMMRKISLMLTVLLLCVSVQAAVTVTTGPEGDFDTLGAQLSTGTSGQLGFGDDASGSLAQTFTMGSQGIEVASIHMTFENDTGNTADPHTLTMYIFEVADPQASSITLPGTTLLTETFDVPYVGGTDTLLNIALGSSVTLNSNTSYAVWIDTSASGSPGWEWNRSTSPVYADGTGYENGSIKTDRDFSLALVGTPVGNAAPIVDAGGDEYMLLSETLALDATATDSDGPSALTYAWTATGPGTATFTPSATVEDPDVTFDAGGIYTLTLEVSDGADTASDSLLVAVRDPAEDALVAHWDFETADAADPGVLDAAGSNDGAWVLADPNTDPNYVDGWITGASPDLAAAFYGDDYNELNNELQFGLTVACWIRIDDPAAVDGFDRIIEKDVWGLTTSSSAETVKFRLIGQPSNGINAVTPVNDGYWHHVTGVYDGQTMSIYIDGILDATDNTWNFLPVTTSNVTIGAGNNYNNRLNGAVVDDVRVYNYGLDAAAVAALAAMGDNLVPQIDSLTSSATDIVLPADTITLTATASDPDLDSLTYAWTADGPPRAPIGDSLKAKRGKRKPKPRAKGSSRT